MKRFYKRSVRSAFVSIILALITFAGYSGSYQQTEMASTHYVPIWDGENGQNHMNFMVVSSILEDLPLSVDDEIAVFSGLNCVGVTKLIKAINPADNTTFLEISASQDDGSGNGFIENDTIIFKIWDNKNQKEVVAKSVTYRKDISAWSTTGKFNSGETSVVEIVSFSELTQTIRFIKGNNLFSTYLSPAVLNMSVVMKSLVDQGYLTKILDESGNTFAYIRNVGWINNIGSIQKTEGYLISVNSNCTFQVTGRLIKLPLDIPLKAGWNYISFPRTDAVNAMIVIQSLIDQNKLVKVQDELGNSIEDLRKFGGWRNGIGNFIPGKAYKINVTSDAILTIQ